MNIGFKIVAFMICLNIASGITSQLLPDLPLSETYNDDTTAKLATLTNSTINPTGGGGSNPETWGDRVLDFLHLGWIKNIVTTVFSFLFGFTDFMVRTFGVFEKPYPYVAMTNVGITFAYALALILLWTGKKLN